MVDFLSGGSNHQERLAFQLSYVTANANYYRLVFNHSHGWQVNRAESGASGLLCPLDSAEFPDPGANHRCLHPSATTLVEDRFINSIGTPDANHGCLLRRWQAQFIYLYRLNPGNVGAFLNSTPAGPLDKEE